MFKHMKYEIKGTYKFIVTLILTVLGASTGLQLYGLSIMNKLKNNNNIYNSSTPPAFIVVILGLVIFGAFITAFFYIIGSFRKELYEDRGYLTFTLPLTGKQILGSKLLIALMWAAILGLSFLIYNFALGTVLFGSEWMNQLNYLLKNLDSNIISITITLILASILSAISTLLLIYFSMTLSKVSLRNTKIGGMWFIVFLILNAVISYGTFKAVNIIPYYIDINSFKIIGENAIRNTLGNPSGYNMSIMSPGTDKGMIVSSAESIVVNIGSLLFSILVTVGTFLGTSYLIEKKIDI